MGVLVTNIQRFSLHDGPGIRTTVFLKGCTIKCPWCCNPENQEKRQQEYVKGMERGSYGKWYTCDMLYDELRKDKSFYEGKLSREEWEITEVSQLDSLPGGVTLSGGEPLWQIEELLPLLERLKREAIHIAVETALFVPKEYVIKALKTIDLFYVDIKIMDEERCAAILHGNLQQFLKNLDLVLQWKEMEGKRKPVVVRIPVIGGYTDNEKNRREIVELLRKYLDKGCGPLKIELMKEHNLGVEKYRSLGYEIPKYRGISDGQLKIFEEELRVLEIPTNAYCI